MDDRFSRTELLLGKEAAARIAHSHVLLFGLGGVGGAAFEALCRAGIGAIDAVDNDEVSRTNINRQALAADSTVGMKKTAAAVLRARDINPEARVAAYDVFVSADTIGMFDFSGYDYVLDAIDTVSAKLLILEGCARVGTPCVSCMGTGNKLDPSLLRLGDIYETSGCPLARVMRRELRKRGVARQTVVWSPEEPRKPLGETDERKGAGFVPGTVSFVPPVAGCLMASAAVRAIAGV